MNAITPVANPIAPSPPSDSTNDKLVTQGISNVIEALGSGNEDVVAELDAIAAAITASIIGGSTGSNADRVLTAKGTTGRALQASIVSIDSSGNVTGVVNITMSGDLQCDDITADDIAAQDGAFSATLTKGGVSVATITQTGLLSFVFAFPENGLVRLVINAPKGFTVAATSTRTTAGTATCTFSINGTPLGGTANAASTSEQTQSHASANVVAAGDDFEVTFSAASGPQNLTITVNATYTLA